MARWGKIGLSLCASVALIGVASTANAELVTFEVIPAYAPKGPESPNWNNYVLNAIAGIQNKQNVGDRETSAAAYEIVDGNVPASEIIYTPFNSWRGAASPNPDFTAPFLGEFGNRIHFGLHVVGTSDWQFQLADLAWKLESDDETGYFDQEGNFAGANYSATRVGIDWGPDGIRGGGDDVILNGGEAGTMPVNELVYVGVGDGFFSSEPDAMTDQQDINITLSDIYAGCSDPEGCLIDVTMTYTLPDHSDGMMSTAGTFVLETPEPSSAVLALIGMVALVSNRRRRK